MNVVERIVKVKRKDGEIIAVLHKPLDEGDKETTFKSRAEPHSDLLLAFQALEPVVREILELPYSWRRDAMLITGATWSLSEGTGVEGACVVASVDLETCNAPLNIVTPHLPFDQYSEGANQPVMPDDGIEALEMLRREVGLYLDGKRAQGDLFTDPGIEAAAKPLRDAIARGEMEIEVRTGPKDVVTFKSKAKSKKKSLGELAGDLAKFHEEADRYGIPK